MEFRLLTIARRATLGKNIKNNTTVVKRRINEAINLNEDIDKLSSFDENRKKINRELTLIGIVSLLEHYIVSLLIDIFECFPNKIAKKQIEVNDILEAGSLMKVLSIKAQEKVDDLARGKFNKMIDSIKNYFDLTSDLPNDLVEQLNEIKCTRDVFTHNDGKCNSLYVQKAGDKARIKEDGYTKEIDKQY